MGNLDKTNGGFAHFCQNNGAVKYIFDRDIQKIDWNTAYVFGNENNVFVTSSRDICEVLRQDGLVPLNKVTATSVVENCNHIISMDHKYSLKDEMSQLRDFESTTIIASKEELDLLDCAKSVMQYYDQLPSKTNSHPMICNYGIQISGYDMGLYTPINCTTVGRVPDLQNTTNNIYNALQLMKYKRRVFDRTTKSEEKVTEQDSNSANAETSEQVL